MKIKLGIKCEQNIKIKYKIQHKDNYKNKNKII